MLTVQVVGSLAFLAVTALTPFIKAEFALSSSAVGLLIVALYLGYFLTLIPGGVLTDIFGERLMIGIGLGFIGLFSIAIGTGSSSVILGVGLFALGCGYSTIPPGTNKGIFDWFPPEQLGVGLGIKQTGVMIGGAIGATLLPLLAARTDWRVAYSAVGAVSLLGLGLLVAYSRPAEAVDLRRASGGTVSGAFRSQVRSFASVYADTELSPLLLVGFLFGAGQFTLMAYVVLYLTEHMKLVPTLAGLLYTAMQLAGVASRIALGYVADRWFVRSKHRLLFAVGVVGSVAYLALASLPSTTPLPLLSVVVVLLGALSLGYNGVYLTIASELAGAEHTGVSTSIAITAVMFGALVTPPVFGLLTDRTGSYVAPMLMVALMTLLAGLFSKRIGDSTRQNTQRPT